MTDLSYDQESELDSLQSILSQLMGWSANEVHQLEQADANQHAETVMRLKADTDRYAQLLRGLYQLPADEVHSLIEELAPVARTVVESSQ